MRILFTGGSGKAGKHCIEYLLAQGHKILNLDQVDLNHPQVLERKFIKRFETVPGVDRPVDIVSVGALFNGQRPMVNTPPPELGQDSATILESLGYSADAVETLRKEGVI